ncbi:zinc finger homeobox protein 2-like [Lacerta agilis]|uniref:zinc finger homeobox protein 2-like n=1 Tax=Lacerta agilis TaxID=80427 RepID=UPI0014194B1D|nr:zinc finger homeobox protein 2-like [Lacerta agilis]
METRKKMVAGASKACLGKGCSSVVEYLDGMENDPDDPSAPLAPAPPWTPPLTLPPPPPAPLLPPPADGQDDRAAPRPAQDTPASPATKEPPLSDPSSSSSSDAPLPTTPSDCGLATPNPPPSPQAAPPREDGKKEEAEGGGEGEEDGGRKAPLILLRPRARPISSAAATFSYQGLPKHHISPGVRPPRPARWRPNQGFTSTDQMSQNTSAPGEWTPHGAFYSFRLARAPPRTMSAKNAPTKPKDAPAAALAEDEENLKGEAGPGREGELPSPPIWLCLICRLSFCRGRSLAAHARVTHGAQLSPDECQALSGGALPCSKAPRLASSNQISPPPRQTSMSECVADETPLKKPNGNDAAANVGLPKEDTNAELANEASAQNWPETSLAPSQQRAERGGGGGSSSHNGGHSLSFGEDFTAMAYSGLTLSGHMSLLHSRNSCKTLKCPKCNWHYKYQQTLDVHMKEKHPENNSHCAYCSSGGPHPRLARGESYNCGYKPYRCEACNYSTTTKGNLSIHMQSDKHLANLQGYQATGGGGGAPSVAPPVAPTPSSPEEKESKGKSSWQCKVCSYETNISRNLRIHMTSEKHMQNMLLLHQGLPLALPGLLGQAQAAPGGKGQPELFQFYGAQALGHSHHAHPHHAHTAGSSALRGDKTMEQSQLLLNGGFPHLNAAAGRKMAALGSGKG